jgi:hypothetical protein
MTTRPVRDRRRREPRYLGRLAWVVCAAAEGIAVACVVLLVAGDVRFGEAVNAYLVTNLGMVVTFAAIGGLVAGNRPRNPIGWLFLGHSACFAVATLAGTIAVVQQATLPPGGLRALLIVFMGVWPLGIGIALPLAVQLFPTGRPLSPRWRWLIWLTVVSGLAFDAQTVLDPAALAVTDRPVPPLVAPAAFHAADPLWAVASLLLAGVLAASVAELVLRFRRARGVERLQLIWLVWAVALFAVLNSQRWITGTRRDPAPAHPAAGPGRGRRRDSAPRPVRHPGHCQPDPGLRVADRAARPRLCRRGAGAGAAGRPGPRQPGGGRRHLGRGRAVPAGPPPRPAGRRPAVQPPPL